jgi:hypothetical protein
VFLEIAANLPYASTISRSRQAAVRARWSTDVVATRPSTSKWLAYVRNRTGKTLRPAAVRMLSREEVIRPPSNA